MHDFCSTMKLLQSPSSMDAIFAIITTVNKTTAFTSVAIFRYRLHGSTQLLAQMGQTGFDMFQAVRKFFQTF